MISHAIGSNITPITCFCVFTGFEFELLMIEKKNGIRTLQELELGGIGNGNSQKDALLVKRNVSYVYRKLWKKLGGKFHRTNVSKTQNSTLFRMLIPDFVYKAYRKYQSTWKSGHFRFRPIIVTWSHSWRHPRMMNWQLLTSKKLFFLNTLKRRQKANILKSWPFIILRKMV